jgi:hypothetical protein
MFDSCTHDRHNTMHTCKESICEHGDELMDEAPAKANCWHKFGAPALDCEWQLDPVLSAVQSQTLSCARPTLSVQHRANLIAGARQLGQPKTSQ